MRRSQAFEPKYSAIQSSPGSHWLGNFSLETMVDRASSRQRRGLHHLIVIQRVNGIPGLQIPVLYLSKAGDMGCTPVPTLTHYLEAHSARSMTWMMQPVRALGMLHDYVEQRGERLQAASLRERPQSRPRDYGAVQKPSCARPQLRRRENGITDETGLFWNAQPTAERSLNLLRGLQRYLDWLGQGEFGSRWGITEEVAPVSDATHALKLAYVARHLKKVDFLAHLDRPGVRRDRRPVISREVVGKATRGFTLGQAMRFPAHLLPPLLDIGFKRRGRVARLKDGEDLTCKLATMICGFGGIRASEALHIWVSDVTVANGKPVVFLHHPAASQVQVGSGRSITRMDHLQQAYGMMPRHLDRGRFWAGWKGMALNSDHAGVMYWLPLPGVPELFWDTFKHYTTEVRPRLMMARRRRGLSDHPWLLVSAGASNENGNLDRSGDPYTIAAFRSGWSRAIQRLRTELDDPTIVEAKHLGTTLHGLRHNYGGMLADAGLAEIEIQQCMHHISPESQKVYTTALDHTVHEALSRAEAATRARGVTLLEEGRTRGYLC